MVCLNGSISRSRCFQTVCLHEYLENAITVSCRDMGNFALLFAFENPCSASAPRWLVAYSINKMNFPALKDPPGLLF